MNKEQIQQKLFDLLSNRVSLMTDNDVSYLGPSWVKTELILDILKDAFNLGLEVAADNAEADYTVIESGDSELSDVEYYVLKGSILKYKLLNQYRK